MNDLARIAGFICLLIAGTCFASHAAADDHTADKHSSEGHASEGHASGDHASADDHAGHDHGHGEAGHGSTGHDAAGHDAAGHDAAGHDSAGGVNPIAIDVDLAWFTLIVFVALAALLKFLAWQPIMDALEGRESNIAGQIAAAEGKHEEAKALLAQHEAKLASAADEVRAMLEEARRDAEVTKSQIVADAQSAAEAERQRAIRDVEQARDSAIKHLAERSANLSIDLAAKVIKQDITPERQGEIVGEALNRLANPSTN